MFDVRLEEFYDLRVDADEYDNIDGETLWMMWKDFIRMPVPGIPINVYRPFIESLDRLHEKKQRGRVDV